jgi:hypothetical protein
MDWKEFLSPTLGKVILSLLVLIILFLIFGIPVKRFAMCKPCETAQNCVCPMYTDFIGIRDFIKSREFIGSDIKLVWYLYVAEFTVSYLISSSIIFLLVRTPNKR